MAEIIYPPHIPPGHIFVNDKWKDTELLKFLKRRAQTVIVDSMDYIDFYPATEFGVIYVTEVDLVAETNYRRNLAKLKKANFDRSAVIVEKTAISGQYFYSMQKFAVLELGLGIIPVTGAEECTQVLVSMVRMGSENKTIFRMKGRVPPLETYLLKTLLAVPSLGETKSQAILLKFKSNTSILYVHDDTVIIANIFF